MLDLQLLGPPRVVVDGHTLEVDTRKAVAVLARIAVDGPASREAVAALLWPGSDEQRARAALRRTLSVLRRGLADRWLVTTRDTVALDGEWRCDVVELREIAALMATHGHAADRPCPDCLPHLQRAAGLTSGDFLSGFQLRDAPAFDLWSLEEAEAVRRDRRRVLSLLVQGLVAGGHLREALVHARTQVDIDPLNEPAQRRLMLLLTWTGRRAEAVRQYQALAAALDAELGVSPLPQTTDLADSIRHDRAPSPPQPSESADFAAAGRSVPHGDRDRSADPVAGRLVGRDDELATLLAVAGSTGDTGRLLALHGEPGAGKTRLASEVAAALAQRGARSIFVRCHPGDARVPYAPVVEALRQARPLLPADDDGDSRHWRAEAARLVPELAGRQLASAASLESPGAQARFLEGVWQTLVAALGTPPGMLLVDDLQRADTATIELLTYAAGRLDRLPVVVLLCWRDGDLRDPSTVATMLHEATAASAPVADVVLGRLDRDAVAALAASSGAQHDAEVVARLYDETEGLPLAVVAYLRALASGDGDWAMPDGLATLYRTQLDELDEVPRQVVTAAAVIGRSFDVATLVAASGRADEEVVAGLEVLLARGMVAETAGSTAEYDFTHDKLRTAAYTAASLARRRLLHGRVGAVLQRGAIVDAAAAAYHEELAGHDLEAATLHVRAGNEARSLYAHGAALEHFARAKALGHPDALGINEAIGDLQTLRGDYRGALTSYDTAAALATAPADRARLDRGAANVHLRQGDLDTALARLGAAEAVAGPGDDGLPLRALIAAERALVEASAGDADAAQASARRALALAESSADERAIAQARNILGVLARRRGDTATAERHLEMSAHLAARLDDPAGEVAALNNLSLALRDSGDLEHATVHAEAAVELCARIGDRHRQAALHSNLADLLHDLGREDEALAHLRESAALFAAVGASSEHEPELWRLTDW